MYFKQRNHSHNVKDGAETAEIHEEGLGKNTDERVTPTSTSSTRESSFILGKDAICGSHFKAATIVRDNCS